VDSHRIITPIFYIPSIKTAGLIGKSPIAVSEEISASSDYTNILHPSFLIIHYQLSIIHSSPSLRALSHASPLYGDQSAQCFNDRSVLIFSIISNLSPSFTFFHFLSYFCGELWRTRNYQKRRLKY
jgi:hypothetical protein